MSNLTNKEEFERKCGIKEGFEFKHELKAAYVYLPHKIRIKFAEGTITKEEYNEFFVGGRWGGDPEVIQHWQSTPMVTPDTMIVEKNVHRTTNK
jgi:hypothetical protein